MVFAERARALALLLSAGAAGAALPSPAADGDGGDRRAVGRDERIIRSRGVGRPDGGSPAPADRAERAERADRSRRFHGRSFDDAFSRMRGLMDRLFQHDPFRGFGVPGGVPSGPGPGTGWGGPEAGGEVTVRESEDGEFKYIIIEGEGLDKDGVGIKVQDGNVLIFGEVKRTAGEGSGRSVSVSSFRRSFPAPDDVDPSGVAFEHDKGKVVIKFPKA